MAISKLNKTFSRGEVLQADDLNSMVQKTNEVVDKANGIPTFLSQLKEDSSHRTVSDEEKQKWNNPKVDGTTDYNQLQNKPSINNVELNGNVDINADTIKVKYSPTGNPFEEEQVSLTQTVGSVSGRLSEIQNEAGQCTSKINTLEDETIPSIKQEFASLGTQIPTNVSELTNDSDFATNAQVQQKIAEAQLSGGGGTAINEVEVNDTGIAPEDPNVELWVDMTDDSPIPTEQKNEVEVNDSGVEPTDPNTELWVDLSEPNQMPTKTSDLINDSHFVSDSSYTHTDNNFTNEEKQKLAELHDGSVVTIGSDGYWYIDGVKTEVKAVGEKGDSGVQLGQVALSQVLDKSVGSEDKVLSLKTASEEFAKLNQTFTTTVDLTPVLLHGNIYRDTLSDWNTANTLRGFRTKLLDVRDAVGFKMVNNTGVDSLVMLLDKDFKKIGSSLEVLKGATLEQNLDTAEYMIINFEDEAKTYIPLDITGLQFSVTNNNKPYELKVTKMPYSYQPRTFGYAFKKAKGNGNVLVDKVSEAVKYSDEWDSSFGIISLPKNYTTDGEPCRLIVYVPGSGTSFTSWGSTYGKWVDYLNAEGYAVAKCRGWGNNLQGMTECWCTPSSYASYHGFFSYLCGNYNIKKEFFAWGKSIGGQMTLAMAIDPTFDLIAACALNATVSPLFDGYGYNPNEKMACLKDMNFSGLEQDEKGNYIGEGACMHVGNINWTEQQKTYWLKNIDKVKWLDPFFKSLTNLDYEDYFFKLYSTTIEQWKAFNPRNIVQKPYLLIDAADDEVVRGDAEKLWAGSQHNQNNCVCRIVPSGSGDPHGAVDGHGVNITIKTRYGETIEGVPMAFAEMLDFFRHYE